MRRSLLSLLALVIAAVILYQFLPDDNSPVASRSQSPEAETKNAAPITELAPQLAQEPAPGINAPRPIAPKLLAQPFTKHTAALERLPPRKALTPKPPKQTGPRRTLLHRPVVTAAGRVTYGKAVLQLEGIDVVETGETCDGPSGSSWPCGIIARTAFRNFLRGRSMNCTVPAAKWSDVITASCQVGTQDPAAWLAGSGWARAIEGSAYAEVAQAAREAGKGLYGDDPRGPRPDLPDSQAELSVSLNPVSVDPPEPSQ